jgi:hypothetical protein
VDCRQNEVLEVGFSVKEHFRLKYCRSISTGGGGGFDDVDQLFVPSQFFPSKITKEGFQTKMHIWLYFWRTLE